jgi:hypothetical protein
LPTAVVLARAGGRGRARERRHREGRIGWSSRFGGGSRPRARGGWRIRERKIAFFKVAPPARVGGGRRYADSHIGLDGAVRQGVWIANTLTCAPPRRRRSATRSILHVNATLVAPGLLPFLATRSKPKPP